MSDLPTLLVQGWQRIGSQMTRLIRDIPADQMTRQAGGILNHPAWTVSHVCHYHPAIISLLLGKAVDDPALAPDADRHDEGSIPVTDALQYRSHAELLELYAAGHARVLSAIRSTSAAVLAGKPGLPRWAESFTDTGDVLLYLMLMHESQHAGQIMAWRRAAGISLA